MSYRGSSLVARPSIDRAEHTLRVSSLTVAGLPNDVGEGRFSVDDDLTWLDAERVAVAGDGRLTVCTLPSSCATVDVPSTGSAPTLIVRDLRS